MFVELPDVLVRRHSEFDMRSSPPVIRRNRSLTSRTGSLPLVPAPLSPVLSRRHGTRSRVLRRSHTAPNTPDTASPTTESTDSLWPPSPTALDEHTAVPRCLWHWLPVVVFDAMRIGVYCKHTRLFLVTSVNNRSHSWFCV